MRYTCRRCRTRLRHLVKEVSSRATVDEAPSAKLTSMHQRQSCRVGCPRDGECPVALRILLARLS